MKKNTLFFASLPIAILSLSILYTIYLHHLFYVQG
jgi:hypothetical protein